MFSNGPAQPNPAARATGTERNTTATRVANTAQPATPARTVPASAAASPRLARLIQSAVGTS